MASTVTAGDVRTRQQEAAPPAPRRASTGGWPWR